MFKTIFTAPLSALYGVIIDVRNKLFDFEVLKSEEVDIPIISVGNITVGGTGKTPVTEYLIEQFADRYNVAVISRGYKRKTKGFILATTTSSFREIGDEPKQIKLKYPQIEVAVCEKRVEGIRQLRALRPKIDLIILDDAFQHRYIEPWVNIVLMDYSNPVYLDKLLPWGRLRDRVSQLSRADFILVTKCPVDMNPLNMRIIKSELNLFPYQKLFYTRMKPGVISPLFPSEANLGIGIGVPIIIMTAIANPASLVSSLNKKYKLIDQFIFPDHYTFRMADMQVLQQRLKTAPADTVVIVTEKDAVKFVNSNKIPQDIKSRLYYIPIQVTFWGDSEKEFLLQIERYVSSNQKHGLLR